jgi:hypothetical protein
MSRLNFKRKAGKEIDVYGINYGPKGLETIARIGNYEIWRSFGHQTWSGRGESSYAPANYYLVDILTEPDPEKWKGEAAEITQVKVGRKWKKSLDEITKLAEFLNTVEGAKEYAKQIISLSTAAEPYLDYLFEQPKENPLEFYRHIINTEWYNILYEAEEAVGYKAKIAAEQRAQEQKDYDLRRAHLLTLSKEALVNMILS